ncbi:DUF3267 domain-containing protein [Natronococcus wangiae]|uniref:DUF3267 domain-containing protein n=1 Tax=Natronococcus wangiae TaxID=3068275 RepID=UPI00273E5617|nr:DUF3267 domain-containing protein [Natronococcus sp. AD5]
MPASAPDTPDSAGAVATVRLTRSIAIQWVLASVVGFFAFAYCFAFVLAVIRGTSLEPIVVTGTALPNGGRWLLVAMGSLVLVVIPHELLHGAFMARYGDAPSYGVGVSHFVLPYAYARTRNASYTRNQLLVALLAPVTIITAAGLLAMAIYPSPVLIVPLAANAAGSVGDLWMAGVLCQYPADVRVSGHPRSGAQGFAIYSPTGATVERLPGAAILATTAAGTVGTLAVSTTVLVGLVFQSLAFGSGSLVVEPNGWTLFRHELRADGAVLEIGGRFLGAIALAGGVAWTLLAAAWRSV